MKKWVALSVLALFSALFSGCTSLPTVTPEQKKLIQTRTFENTSYEKVFEAFKTVLQADGYTITTQDLQGGTVVAAIEKSESSNGVWAGTGMTATYRTGSGFEVFVKFEKINPTTIESQTNVKKINRYSDGAKQVVEFWDEAIYKSFYEAIKEELGREKPEGRNDLPALLKPASILS